MNIQLQKFLLALTLLTATATVQAQGTAFTYQGRLTDNSAPANGLYSFTFTLIHRNRPGLTLTNDAVAVSNGLFTTILDFGDLSGVLPLSLEIAVRTNGSAGPFVTLVPRQPITPTPLAIAANHAAVAESVLNVPDGALPSNVVRFDGNGDLAVVNNLRARSGDFQGSLGVASNLTIAGSAGIGTTNPVGRLHVYSPDNPTTIRLQSSAGPGFGRIEFVSDPQGNPNEWRPAYIQSTDRGDFTGGLAFFVNGSGPGNKFASNEVMRIVNKRVGIGTPDPATALHVIGTVTATAFNPPSDRNLKENFQPVNPRHVLDKVALMPITSWNFKGDAPTPHIGPMAQDFHAAFGLGTDDKHIATVDADGVALAAIQGLNQKVEEKDLEIRNLRSRLERLEQLLTRQLNAGEGE